MTTRTTIIGHFRCGGGRGGGGQRLAATAASNKSVDGRMTACDDESGQWTKTQQPTNEEISKGGWWWWWQWQHSDDCMKWLGDVGRGMNCDEHMADHWRKIIEVRSLEISGVVIDKDAPRLFELGPV
jgi:hypothetical protein